MKKLPLKNIVLIILLLLVVLQFIPSAKNTGEAKGPNDLSTVVNVPVAIDGILRTSCNDCHCNYTEYPWYSKIQPVGFWLEHHVNEGKAELNFSEFATYSLKRQLHKLDEITEMVEEHEMPLSSYTLIHTNAKLSAEQEAALIQWVKESKAMLTDTMAVH